jgi:hypothetical protein
MCADAAESKLDEIKVRADVSGRLRPQKSERPALSA